MSILRTPDQHFADLPDFPYPPHYVEVNGMRMHYVDEGAGDELILCLHGEPTWAYLYRKVIAPLSGKYRVVAPDFIGFGRSDKYTELGDYTYHMHLDSLVSFIEALDLTNITLVVQDWGGVLGLTVATMLPDRFARLVVMNTFLPGGDSEPSEAFVQWRAFAQKTGTAMRVGALIRGTMVSTKLPTQVTAAYDAPFPDDSYKAGPAMFPLLVPMQPDDPGAAEGRAARKKLMTWDKPALVMFSDSDPILGAAVPFFRKLLPTAKDQPEIVIEGAGHFLQEEKGEEIAGHIDAFLQRS